jgi:hypothetical protein
MVWFAVLVNDYDANGQIFWKTLAPCTKNRCFYEIVYEDGDREDMNERELKAGLELYSTLPERHDKVVESEQSDNMISDSEGSEYNLASDEEHKRQQKKKNKLKDAQRKDMHSEKTNTWRPRTSLTWTCMVL